MEHESPAIGWSRLSVRIFLIWFPEPLKNHLGAVLSGGEPMKIRKTVTAAKVAANKKTQQSRRGRRRNEGKMFRGGIPFATESSVAISCWPKRVRRSWMTYGPR
jgi:hypothetical protein